MVLHKEKQTFYADRIVEVGQNGRLTSQIWGYNKCIRHFGQETPRKSHFDKREMEGGGYKIRQVV